MDGRSLVDRLRVWPFNLIVGILAGVAVATFLTVINLTVHQGAIQVGLVCLVIMGVSTFAYKTEVKRQTDEIERERRPGHSSKDGGQRSLIDDRQALRRGLKAALRPPGPADYLIRRWRR
jgi:hypothetical protein